MEKTFSAKCYELLKQVPKGRVTTYRELALGLGTGAFRAVGRAMNKNPYHYKEVPCHRVVNASGELGGFAYDIEEKIRRLKEDGVEVKDNKIVDFKNKLFKFINFN